MVRSSLVLFALVALAACDNPPPGMDAGMVDAQVVDDAPRDAPRDSGFVDPNGTFETATMVTPHETMTTAEVIQPAGDVDYFQFSGTAGQWIIIYTGSDETAMPRVDTVVTLYDSARTQIAENDGNVDSEIIIRLPTTGTYYVRVQDFSTFMPATPPAPRGGPTLAYQLGIEELTSSDPRILIDAEPGDDAASATDVDIFARLGVVLGQIDDATDVDVFRIYNTSSMTAPESLNILVMPPGPMGYGATRTAGRIWITDPGGNIVARRSIDAMTDGIAPALTMGGGAQHLIWVEAPSGALGANDHYVVKVIYGAENTPEAATPNETLATAQIVMLVPDEMGTAERYFALPRLPAGDVDYFGFDVVANRQLTVVCGSRTAGSGIMGLTVSVRDSADAELGMDVETETEFALVEDLMLPSAGRYYVRLSATGMDPEVTGDWIRCGIHAVPPAP
jgi:hypothetical protein